MTITPIVVRLLQASNTNYHSNIINNDDDLLHKITFSENIELQKMVNILKDKFPRMRLKDKKFVPYNIAQSEAYDDKTH